MLAGEQAAMQAGEGGEAGPALEDAPEAALELCGAFRAGVALAGQGAGVEPPDRLAGEVRARRRSSLKPIGSCIGRSA